MVKKILAETFKGAAAGLAVSYAHASSYAMTGVEAQLIGGSQQAMINSGINIGAAVAAILTVYTLVPFVRNNRMDSVLGWLIPFMAGSAAGLVAMDAAIAANIVPVLGA